MKLTLTRTEEGKPRRLKCIFDESPVRTTHSISCMLPLYADVHPSCNGHLGRWDFTFGLSTTCAGNACAGNALMLQHQGKMFSVEVTI